MATMQTTLLYVRSPRQPHAGGTHEASVLDPSQIPHDECEDIYRALARLCRPDGETIDAVVVALDGLQPDEFDFFALARRSRPDVNVYVHADHDARNLIALAIEQGAAGELTEATLLSLQSRCASSDAPLADHAHKDAQKPQDPQPPTLGQDIEPNQLDAALPDDEERHLAGEPDPNEQAPPDIAEQACSGPVPVPWSNRQDPPRRIRPAAKPWTHHADEKPDNDPDANTPGPDALSEPLLTQEELRALISDEPDPPPPPGYDRSSDSEAP